MKEAAIKYLIAGLLSVFLIHQVAPKLQAPMLIKKPIRTALTVQQALDPVSVKERPVIAQSTVAVETKQVTGTCEQYRLLLTQYGWNVNVMFGIMRAESQCNPNAVNTHNYDGVYDYGLLQLHGQNILDPSQNVAAAYHKWRVQGYRAWTTYNTGAYLAYL